jgi:hypothetical protein
LPYRVRAVAQLLLAGVVLAGCGAPEAASFRFDAAAGLTRAQNARAVLLSAWERRDALRGEEQRLLALTRKTPADRTRQAEVEARLPQADAAFDAAWATDQADLAEFLNTALAAAPQAPETRAALDLYAESAMRYAAQIVGTRGDYRRASELLDTARGYFLDAQLAPPQPLDEALQRARSYRVVTKERFARLARGMTTADVKALVGVPFSGNVHSSEVAGRTVTSWLYGSEDRGVAAVYFDDRGTLYAWKWDVMQGE